MSKPSPIADLYIEHHPWLHGWLRRKLHCADQAADLAQDTFVRVMSSERTAVADLRISGTFPALDVDRSLQLLVASFPLKLRSRTRYWVTVEPA